MKSPSAPIPARSTARSLHGRLLRERPEGARHTQVLTGVRRCRARGGHPHLLGESEQVGRRRLDLDRDRGRGQVTGMRPGRRGRGQGVERGGRRVRPAPEVRRDGGRVEGQRRRDGVARGRCDRLGVGSTGREVRRRVLGTTRGVHGSRLRRRSRCPGRGEGVARRAGRHRAGRRRAGPRDRVGTGQGEGEQDGDRTSRSGRVATDVGPVAALPGVAAPPRGTTRETLRASARTHANSPTSHLVPMLSCSGGATSALGDQHLSRYAP